MCNDSKKISLVEYAEKLSSLSILVTVAVYYLGFVFIQGTIMNSKTPIFDSWYKVESSISSKYIVINGIVQIIMLLTGFALAFAVVSIMEMILNHSMIISKLEYLYNKLMESRGLKLVAQLIFAAVFICNASLLYFINIPLSNRGSFNISQAFLYYTSLMFILILLYINTVYVAPKIFIEAYRKFSRLLFVEIVAYVLICFTLFIYNVGSATFNSKVNKYIEGKGAIKVSTLYMADNQEKTYITIDDSGDYFVGYDNSSKSIVLVSMQTVLKIETKELGKVIKKDYSIKDIDNKKDLNDADNVALTIINYYKFRTDKQFSYTKEFIDLLSDQYYSKGYDRISPDNLAVKWKNSKKFWDKDIEQYIGLKVTEPVVQANKCEVAVVEYWNDGNNYVKFSLIKNNDMWKIDDVEKCEKFIVDK